MRIVIVMYNKSMSLLEGYFVGNRFYDVCKYLFII